MFRQLSLVALARAVADADAHIREVPLYSNLGPRVEQYQRTAGVVPPQPYCACGIYTWFHEAAANIGMPCPLLQTGYCPTLAAWGHAQGRVIAPADAQPGDIIVFWFPALGRFAHTEICRENPGGGVLLTVGANTNDNGARDGDGVYHKRRQYGPKDIAIRMHDYGVTVPDAPAAKPVAPLPEFTGVKVFGPGGEDLFHLLGQKVTAEYDKADGRIILRVG